MQNTRTRITQKQLKQLHTLHEINLEALHHYIMNYCPHRASYVLAKLMVYSVEHKNSIHLDFQDTEELKGMLALLQELEESKIQLMS